jgi:thiamine-monophosphate kinase
LWISTFLALTPSPAYHVFALPLPERELIARIRRRVEGVAPLLADVARSGKFSPRHIVTGIGDDCSILRIPPGSDALITTDFSLEGVHFRRDWHPPEVVGHRCLARGLSDIAAMGAEPIAAFLSLALPAKLPQRWVDGFLRGLLNLAARSKTELAGGDTAESPNGVLADIVVLGSVAKGRAILRSGARPGDALYVTGELGASAATLNLLSSGRKAKLRPEAYPQHFFPVPRIAMGKVLREKRIASAMIDLSDGLSTELFHICEESGVGAEVQEGAIPRAHIGEPKREVDSRFALHGGEDYELLFTSPKPVPAKIAGVPITKIGRITRKKKLLLLDSVGRSRELRPAGWEHFRS